MTDEKNSNVLLWVPRYWPAMGGTELHTRQLAIVLSDEHTVNVITHCYTSENPVYTLEQDATGSADSTYVDNSVDIACLCMNGAALRLLSKLANHHTFKKITRLAYSKLFPLNLSTRASAYAQDTQVIHFIYNGLTDAAMLAASLAKKHDVPFIFTPNILDTSNRAHAWNSRRFQYLYESAARIIALTPHEAKWLESQDIPREKIEVLPYGPILEGIPDSKRFRQTLNIGNAKIALFLARIIPLKGYDLLLGACAEIWQKHPDTHIIFMGPATQETRNAINQIEDPRIHLLEQFDQGTKSDALAACDLLCLPSRKESLGVVYIEAAYNAKPVVALNLPVLQDVIRNGIDGLLVDESVSGVADAVISLLNDPEESKRMGLTAQVKAKKDYDWSNVKVQISRIYRQAIAEHPYRTTFKEQLANGHRAVGN